MLSKLFGDFFSSEKTGSIILLICTIISLIIANSAFSIQYTDYWNTDFGNHSITHWINDGLMAIFFLLIGLELEREIYIGELSSLKKASLPVMAAIGGMIVPAIIYKSITTGTVYSNGTGIPMATDIAFAIGILSLTGKSIPASLKVFLTALAVIDDLGAIIVIALFYSSQISIGYLSASLSIFVFLLILNRLKVHNLLPYLIGGIFMWYFMLHSGVHSTIAGVLLAFAIPFGDGSEKSPSYILQHLLHKPVAFFILPLFALANTAILLESNWHMHLMEAGSAAVLAGLYIGKPLGIFSASYFAVKTGLSSLPDDLNWKHVIGAGMLGGIGFTMSYFITVLAFDDPEVITTAKIAVLVASVLSGVTGFLYLKNQKQTIQS